MISDELIRTAMLLRVIIFYDQIINFQEMWVEGIEEAWKAFTADKQVDPVMKILFELHEKMDKAPCSISEITFH